MGRFQSNDGKVGRGNFPLRNHNIVPKNKQVDRELAAYVTGVDPEEITGIHEAIDERDEYGEEPVTITTAIDILNTAQDEAFSRVYRLCASLDALCKE